MRPPEDPVFALHQRLTSAMLRVGLLHRTDLSPAQRIGLHALGHDLTMIAALLRSPAAGALIDAENCGGEPLCAPGV